MADTHTLIKPPPEPMLARPGTLSQLADAAANGYVIENKVDGIRCIAVVGDGVQLYNRQLRNITAAFPDVVALLQEHVLTTLLVRSLVLDGEIYVRDEHGEPDFQLVQHRANRQLDIARAVQEYPARFAAFDILQSNVLNYCGYALAERKAVLTECAGSLAIATYTQEEADDRASREVGEGLMLKHTSSRYYPGERSAAWLKVKWLREVEVYIGGVTYGYGKRDGYFGGLLVGVYRPEDKEGTGRLTYIGTVGTGFNDADLESIALRLRRLRTTVNPFNTRGTDWDLMHYVQPVLQAKVRFASYTRDGMMRFPRFIGLL